MKRIFEKARAEGRAVFIAYVTAGDPDFETSVAVVETLAANGADIIELGVPFSDPLADGIVNQRAAARALHAGVRLPQVLDIARTIRKRGVKTPLVIFSYFNPILRMGLREFARRAQASGIDGVLCLDLPLEEATEYRNELLDVGVQTVFLVSPLTPVERIQKIDVATTGFIYYVSRTGVTGAGRIGQAFSATLSQEIAQVRAHTKNPVAVGFGIATAAQAHEIGQLAAGVIVGSAIVQRIENAVNEAVVPGPAAAATAVAKVGLFAREISQGLKARSI